MFWVVRDFCDARQIFDSNTNSLTHITDEKLIDVLKATNETIANADIKEDGTIEEHYDLDDASNEGYFHIAKLKYKDRTIHKILHYRGDVEYVTDSDLFSVDIINNKDGKPVGCVEYDNTNIGHIENRIESFLKKARVLGYNIELEYYVEGDNVILTNYENSQEEFIIPKEITALGGEVGYFFTKHKGIDCINIDDNIRYLPNYLLWRDDIKINMGKNVIYAYTYTAYKLYNLRNINPNTIIISGGLY